MKFATSMPQAQLCDPSIEPNKPDILVKRLMEDNPTLDPLPALSQNNDKFYLKRPLKQLLKNGCSLTQNLNHLLQDCINATVLSTSLSPLSQQWQNQLGLRTREQWYVRTACLSHSNGMPLVMAQSIYTRKPFKELGHELHHCGNSPIGNLLFRGKHQPQRKWIFTGKIDTQSLPRPWQLTLNRFSNKSINRIWVRQSLLAIKPAPICLTEFFLPSAWDYLAKMLMNDFGKLVHLEGQTPHSPGTRHLPPRELQMESEWIYPTPGLALRH